MAAAVGPIGKRGPTGPHLLRDAVVGVVSALVMIGGPITASQIRGDLAEIKRTQVEISQTQEAQEARIEAQERRVQVQAGKINELLDALADFIRHNSRPLNPRPRN